MRDLEIRGAGEILGANQSGTMQTVGVSHYLRMLKSAVEEMKAGEKGGVEEEEATAEILLPVEAMLPSFYITDEQERISVYQKLAGSEEESTLHEFEVDLRDEYGEPPKQVLHLFAILRLKLACRRAGVIRIKVEHEGDGDVLVLVLSSRVRAKEIMQLLKDHPHWKVSGTTLKAAFGEFVGERAKDEGTWLARLTKEVLLLAREGKK
jgi:transcription-repair coupling factor (superfamily II helicase)